MTDKEFQEMILKSIEECYWRKEVYGVDICTGSVLPCAAVIEKGECDIIRKKMSMMDRND